MAVDEARGAAGSVRFEARRSVLTPVRGDVALLELEGVFVARSRRSVGRPRLVVTVGGQAREFRAVEARAAHAEPDPAESWTAAFALPLTLAEREGAAFALAVGRSQSIELGPPDRPSGPDERPDPQHEGEGWGRTVIELADTRHELSETKQALARAHDELAALRAEVDRPDTPAVRTPVTWLDEVEAEAAREDDDPDGELDEHENVDEDDDAALPVLANRRVVPPSTMEHEAVYAATLKRVQLDRRARLRRRRILGRLLAVVVFAAAGVALYEVIDKGVGIDILKFF